MKIEVSNLSLSYGEFPAVRNLDLEINDGEMVVLLGPSGCGKTSVMRCIVGLERPSAGRIRIGERVVFDADHGINIPTNRRNIGMVFQSYAIWPHKTVLENVTFPIEIRGDTSKAQARQRGREILENLELGDQVEKGASLLSGGQMQRVALARSLAMESDVLLFDEPLSNLDAALRDKLRFELKELQYRFRFTAVYVTHDLGEALAIADRVAVMRAGRIEQIGTPRDVYENPRSVFVANVLGISNRFRVHRIERDQGATHCVCLDDGLELISDRTPSGSANMTACIRPEHVLVRLSQQDDGEEADNRLLGTLTVSSFLGNQIRYEIRTDSGARFDASSTDVDNQIPAGSRVAVYVKPEHVLILGERARDG